MIRLLLPIWMLFLPWKAAGQSPVPFLAYIADTQAPMWIEDVFLESNRNEAATRILLNDLASRRPSRTFLLGDAVNLAHKDNRWPAIDSALAQLRASGCPVHACLGNHELMGKPEEGERKFQHRFPDHINTGYVVTCDSIATLLLNSNFSKMTFAQVATQKRWVDSTLYSLDTAAGILAVVVTCHHPPFSDSRLVGSSKAVQEQFVPPFLKSKKCRIFITGHAHLFQHKKVEGKDFVIIGGGGGLQHPMISGSAGPADLAAGYKPMFHYLTVTRQPGKLEVISHRLDDDFSTMAKGYSFEVTLPGPGRP